MRQLFAGFPLGKMMMSLGCLVLLTMAAGCPTTAMPDASVGSDAQVSDAVATSDVPVVTDAFVAVDAPLAVDAFVPADAPASIAIAGRYMDEFGGTHVVTNTRWDTSGMGFMLGFRITRFDNTAGVAIAQNDASNMYNPSLFSRFEYFRVGSALYMCQSPYDAASEAAAMSAPASDRMNLMSGCGGFGWSVLTPL